MNQSPEEVTIVGDETIELNQCYVFKNKLAHEAKVSIASAVSYTEHPHLLYIDVKVPGNRSLTLSLGIPFQQAIRMTNEVITWNESLIDYNKCMAEITRRLFNDPISDLTTFPWSDDAVRCVEEINPDNEIEAVIKSNLLKMAKLSLGAKTNE